MASVAFDCLAKIEALVTVAQQGRMETRMAAEIIFDVCEVNYRRSVRERSEGRVGGWSGLRRDVLDRDNGTCQACGGSEVELDVHHKVPRRVFPTPAEANFMDNLVALCRPCHARADAEYRATGKVFGA